MPALSKSCPVKATFISSQKYFLFHSNIDIWAIQCNDLHKLHVIHRIKIRVPKKLLNTMKLLIIGIIADDDIPSLQA